MRQTKIIGAAAALTALAGITAPALAADLGAPARQYPAWEPRRPIAIERWTGFYLGGTLGGQFGDTAVSGFGAASNVETDGLVGTLFAGYDWQFGNAVLGLEADIGTGDVSGSSVNGFGTTSASLNYMGSVRGRAGILMTPSLLAYVTGGFAWADYDLTAFNGITASETFAGYQIGAGAELKLDPRWGLRVEYVYTDLDSANVSHGGLTNTYDPDFHTIRAGLSFRF